MTAPTIDATDPAQLAAMHGPFGLFQDWRKVVLASCAEAERAKATASGEKVSESRLSDLAHVAPAYVAFLARGLEERIAYERATRESVGV